jgi:hypothetical protein
MMPRSNVDRSGTTPRPATGWKGGMDRKARIYVAGPYTGGDPCINTHKAITIGDQILTAGGIPFVPHLFHFWHTVSPKRYDVWTEMDFVWLEACDALYRFAGDSPGADAEVATANRIGIPVFHDLDSVLELCRRYVDASPASIA